MDLGTHTSPHTPFDSSAPVPATLPLWERTMRRAQAAERMGQAAMALAYQQQALALSLRVLEQSPPPGREDDCIAAVVVSHLNVADLQAQAAEIDACARLLCQAHALLQGLLTDGRRGIALRQAAWRHRREILSALQDHLRSHGPHPAIAEALALPFSQSLQPTQLRH
ncbi:hypothetical protein [Acidovorax sp.]|uniref:hypothetical protein n=1 Tax=Acidovorax sp. TaxID=1872122 RepID=UPI0026297817|nr:hypothetical protein [Acidovorax sp.]